MLNQVDNNIPLFDVLQIAEDVYQSNTDANVVYAIFTAER